MQLLVVTVRVQCIVKAVVIITDAVEFFVTIKVTFSVLVFVSFFKSKLKM